MTKSWRMATRDFNPIKGLYELSNAPEGLIWKSDFLNNLELYNLCFKSNIKLYTPNFVKEYYTKELIKRIKDKI